MFVAYCGGNRFCSGQVFPKAVLNVHNLSLARYCEQDRLSLYIDGGFGGGILSVTIESEVRLKKTLFGHFIENAAEDSCRAGKARVRGGAGECCCSCCGRNSRRG